MKLSQSGNPSASNSPGKSAAVSAAATTEEMKHVSNTAKSPFRSSNSAPGDNKKGSPKAEDDIEEDIV